jgi:hypothetical protein
MPVTWHGEPGIWLRDHQVSQIPYSLIIPWLHKGYEGVVDADLQQVDLKKRTVGG